MKKSSNKRKLTKEERENLKILGELIFIVVAGLIATACFMFFLGSRAV
jgi:hypothetical protein